MQFTEGGCLCKAIRYRIAGEPVYSAICHCESCRRASAAPSVAWLTFHRRQIEMLAGEPRHYRSSPDVIRQFCGTCGSPIFYETAGSPGTIDLTTASLDDPTTFPPTREVWVEEKLWWEPVSHTLDQYPRDNGAGPYADD